MGRIAYCLNGSITLHGKPSYWVHSKHANAGREVDLPIDLPVQGGNNEDDSCHLSIFIGNLKNIRELGRRELRRNLVRQKTDFDARLQVHHYCPGDLTFRQNSANKLGESSKLTKRFTGPWW